jgi:cytochrome d ubiquinol oxidase subunit II
MPAYSQVWFTGNRQIWIPLFGGATILCLAAAWLSSRPETGSAGPYAWSVAAFSGAGGTAVAAIYPCIIPFSITIPEAASPTSSLVFMLFGVGILLPVIILYNIYVARVFSREGPQSRR